MPELPMPKEDATIPDSWARAVNSSAEVREKVGSEFKVVGSGYIKDAGLLMLRSGDRYYLAQIKENKVTEVKEQKICWRTLEDTVREYPGLENARVVMRSILSSSFDDIFYSLVALTPEKSYFVAMDKNRNITDVDPIEPNAWLDMVRSDKEVRENIGGGRWKLRGYDVLPWEGQNMILLSIEAGGKQHSVSIEPDGSVEYSREYDIPENKSSSQNQDPLEVAKNDERIRELIDGKEYAFGTPTFYSVSGVTSYGYDNTSVKTSEKKVESYASITLNVEGRYYRIRVSDEEVVSITSLEEDWLSTLKYEDIGVEDYRLIGSCRATIGSELIAILFIESEGNVYTAFLDIGIPEVRYVEKIK